MSRESGAIASAPDDAVALRAFVARVRSELGRAAAAHTLALVGLPLALALLVLWPFVPLRSFAVALLTGAAVTGLATLLAWWRARRAAVRAFAGFAALPAWLGDGLQTWLEQERLGRSGVPMTVWLAQDLRSLVGTLPPRQRIVRRLRLGRVRWLIPIVLLLFLLHLLAGIFSLRTPGLVAPEPPPPPQGGAGVGILGAGGSGDGPAENPGDGSDRDRQQPEAAQQPQPEQPQPEPEPKPPEPEPEPEPPPPPLPPAPFLDLPTAPEVVVPEFVGDGPTRRALVRAASVEDGGEAGAPRPRSPQHAGAGGERPDRPAPRIEFERAAERAQRSRHVPDEERSIVQRYFRELQERQK